MTEQKSLCIGFVGAGFNTQFHMESLVQVRDCHVGGVVSRTAASANRCAEMARRLGLGFAKPFVSAEEMAADSAIDAIWINSPNHSRIQVMTDICAGNARREKPLLGIACEKPLARNLVEADQMCALADECGVPTGYLENQIFSPAVERGKEVIWRRAVPATGRPYLARAAEEHSGPHAPWFWRGELQGGGAMNDMMCHSVETARFLLNEPGQRREALEPIEVSAHIASLKWTRPEYAQELQAKFGDEVDYLRQPSEDYAHAVIKWRDAAGNMVVTESTTSWSYEGAGLRLSFELLGPEYSMRASSIDTGLDVFFSRRINTQAGEDLIEKQNAEQGMMPIVPEEASAYGYAGENRHMVNAFLDGVKPQLTFHDGREVVRLLMAAYQSAESGQNVNPAGNSLQEFIPAVARGAWRP